MPMATLAPFIPTGANLTAMLVVICFSAGLNVYATVAMLGLLARAQVLALPQGLHAAESWTVISICCALFLVEFFGDKIPVFDLLWNALQTFVRVPVAGILTYAATPQLPEGPRLLATLLGAAIALAAHGGKLAARAAVTHSPEPFSNAALSLGEDGLVVFLTWFMAHDPVAAAAIAVAGLAIVVLAIRFVASAIRRLFRGSEEAIASRAQAAPAPGTH